MKVRNSGYYGPLKKSRHSLGVTLPIHYADQLAIECGNFLKVQIEGNRVMMEKVNL
jgi:antitoxin component of MazEF toxin-antitoxin module